MTLPTVVCHFYPPDVCNDVMHTWFTLTPNVTMYQ